MPKRKVSLTNYLQQKRDSVINAAIDRSYNREMPELIKVPLTKDKRAFYEDLKNEYLGFADAYLSTMGNSPIDTYGKEYQAISRFLDVANDAQDTLDDGEYGFNCLNTATSNFGDRYKYHSNVIFSEDPSKYGFKKVDRHNFKPGDLVQNVNNGVPNHAMLFVKYDDNGLPLFNYSNGQSAPEALRVEMPYSFTDSIPNIYEFVGTQDDIDKWTKEYNQKAMGGNTLIKNGRPNVIRGGSAKQFAPGLFYMQGRSHANGGIPIGPNNKNGVEVEGGEVVQLGKGGMRVFSAQPFLTGKSPANLVANGANPDVVFAAQENFKDRLGINDDGTMAQVGGQYKPGTIYGRPIEKGLEIVSPEFDVLTLGRLIGSSVGKSAVSGLQNLPTAKERIAATNKAFRETAADYKSAMGASGEDIIEGIKNGNIKYIYDGLRDGIRATGGYLNYLIDTPTRYLNNYLETKSRPYARMIKYNYNNLKNIFPTIFLDEENNEKKMGGLSRSKDYGSKSKPYPSVDKKDFAGGGRSYPIPTKADAKDALRLAGLHGRNDVKEKVYRKYPELRPKKPIGGVVSINGNVKNGLIYTNRPIARGGIGISVEEADARRKSTPTYGGERPSALSRFLNFVNWLDEKTHIIHDDENHHTIEAEAPIIGPSGPLVAAKAAKAAKAVRSGSRVLTKTMKNAEANIKRVNTRIASGTATDNMLEGAIKSEQEYANALKNYENMFDRVGTRQVSTTTRGGNYAARRAEPINPANLPVVVDNGLYVPNYTTGTQLANAARQRAVLRAQARADKAVARTAAEEAEKAKRAAAAQKAAQTRANNKAVETAKAEADKLRQQRLNLIEAENRQRAAENVNNAINMRQAAYDQRAADEAIISRLREPRPTTWNIRDNVRNVAQNVRDNIRDKSIVEELGKTIYGDKVLENSLYGVPNALAWAALTTPPLIESIDGAYLSNDTPDISENVNQQNVTNRQSSLQNTARKKNFIQDGVDNFTNRITRIGNEIYPIESDLDRKLRNIDTEPIKENETPFTQDRIVLTPLTRRFNIIPKKVDLVRGNAFKKKLGGDVRRKAVFGEDDDWRIPVKLWTDNIDWYRVGQQVNAQANGNRVARNTNSSTTSEPVFTDLVWDDIFNEAPVRGDRPAVSGLPRTNFSDAYKLNIPDKIDVDGKIREYANDKLNEQYNTSGILSDPNNLAAIAGAVGSLGSYLINNNTLNKIKPKLNTVRLSSQKLKTNYNINPQLDTLREEAAANNRLTANNTASSRTALNRINLINTALGRANAEQYGIKENKETELINQDILNAQNIANQEAIYNAQLREAYNERLDDWNRMKMYNTNALFNGLSGAINNYVNNRNQERYYNNTIAAIAARNPNVAAEIFGDAGVDWDTVNPYSVRNKLRVIRRKLKH